MVAFHSFYLTTNDILLIKIRLKEYNNEEAYTYNTRVKVRWDNERRDHNERAAAATGEALELT